jgi:hypothetical protein
VPQELKTSGEWVVFIETHDPEKITGISRIVDYNTWHTSILLTYDGDIVEYMLEVAQRSKKVVNIPSLTKFNKRIRSLEVSASN